jgi:hypothetical protein
VAGHTAAFAPYWTCWTSAVPVAGDAVVANTCVGTWLLEAVISDNITIARPSLFLQGTVAMRFEGSYEIPISKEAVI